MPNALKISKGQTLVMEFRSVSPSTRHIDGKYPKDVYVYPVVADGREQDFEVTAYLKSILEGRDGGVRVEAGKTYAISCSNAGGRIAYEVTATTDSPYTAPTQAAPQSPSAFGLPSGKDETWYRDEFFIAFNVYLAKFLESGIEGVSMECFIEQASTCARGEIIAKLRGDIS